MGVPKFVIVLDSPTSSYYAGTNVTGRVLLTLDKQKKFRGLKIKFLGKAHVAWSEQESVRKNNGDTSTETVSYHAEEEYFSYKYYLAGSASNEIEIPPGEHVYPFTATLPPQLPTSLEGEYGYIRYTIVATLDRPWKMDYEAKAIFQVVTPLDLNYHNLAKEPVKKEEVKTFCCLCCESGPLTVVACVPHTGYVAGQDIPVTVEVDNASNVTVELIHLLVQKKIKWTVRHPSCKTKDDHIDLTKMSLEGVEAGGSKSLTQNIAIPQMPYVNVDACSIIDVTFSLKVTACVSGMCNQNLTAKVPLILGTIPIYNAQQAGGFAPTPIAMTNISPGPQPPPIGMGGDQPYIQQPGVPQPVMPQPDIGGGGYGQPAGFAAPAPPPGFSPGGGIPMADGSTPGPQNGSGFVTPVQPGQFGASNQPMYPQPVYPDLSIEKLPTSGPLGFNVSPSAPPAETQPLMNKPK